MKNMSFTPVLAMLGFACALGLAPAMAQTASGTMAPVANTAPAAAPAMTTAPKATPATTTPTATAAKPSKALEFSTLPAATAHCPSDTVVWSTLSKSHSFHLSGSHYYGTTKHGAYMCKADAVAAGFHQAKN